MEKDLVAIIKREPQVVNEQPTTVVNTNNRHAARPAEKPATAPEEDEDQDNSNRWQQQQQQQTEEEEEDEEDDNYADPNHYQADSPTTNAITNNSNNNNTNHNSNNQKNKKLFPQKLWDLINDDKYNFCLRWSEDGQLVYLNRDDFEDSYLKTAENQFHTQKAISFVRQMNMYGFRKVDDCYYENDNFKRDCKYLLKNMIRKHPNKNSTNNNLHQQQHQQRQPQQNDHGTAGIAPYLYANNSTATSAAAVASALFQSSAATAASSILKPSQHRQHHYHQQQNLNFNNLHQSNLNQQPAFMDYRQRLNQYQIYNNISCNNRAPHPPNGGNISDSIIVKANNYGGHLLHQQHLLEEERSSNDDSLSSVGDYCCSAGSSLMGDTSIINVLDKTDSVDQFLTIKQQQQLTNTQYPRDLSTASTKTNQQQHLNIQNPDTNTSNLNAFYALLSALNNNLYHQPSAHMEAHQNLAFDMNRFSSLQHIYQQILTPPAAPTISPENCGSNNTSVTQCHNAQHQQQATLVPPTKRIDCRALRNQASDKDTSSLSTSLLMRNKFSTNAAKSGISIEMFENGCQFGERSHERNKDSKPLQHNFGHALAKPISNSEPLSTAKRRDNNKSSMTNRLFKRSVDSILDSNNNNNNNTNNATSPKQRSPSNETKRMKLDPEEFIDVQSDGEQQVGVSDYAKNLVAQVALAREVRVDPDVILEASRFTQRFVETLFDTAQVISRHSNSSSGSTSVEAMVSTNDHCSLTSGEVDSDVKAALETEKPRPINLNDLTSALKLLPSKISKLPK